jgi:tetratricopeptide (TPR) repeat protein
MRSYRRAYTACNETLKLSPNYVIALHFKGLILQRIAYRLLIVRQNHKALRALSKAVAAFDHALEQGPDCLYIYKAKLRALQDCLKHQSNREALTSYQQIAAVYDEIIRLEPRLFISRISRAEALYQQAFCLEQEKNSEKALEIFQKAIDSANEAIKSHKYEVQLYEIRGKALAELGQLQENMDNYAPALENIESGIASYDESLKRSPYNFDLYLRKGLAFWERGILQTKMDDREAALLSYGEAAKAFNRCMDQQPATVVARFGRGDLIVDQKTLQAKMLQGRRPPISYKEAQKAIEHRYRLLHSSLQ